MHVIACALHVQPVLAMIELIPLGAMAIALLVMGGYGVLQLWPGQQARRAPPSSVAPLMTLLQGLNLEVTRVKDALHATGQLQGLALTLRVEALTEQPVLHLTYQLDCDALRALTIVAHDTGLPLLATAQSDAKAALLPALDLWGETLLSRDYMLLGDAEVALIALTERNRATLMDLLRSPMEPRWRGVTLYEGALSGALPLSGRQLLLEQRAVRDVIAYLGAAGAALRDNMRAPLLALQHAWRHDDMTPQLRARYAQLIQQRLADDPDALERFMNECKSDRSCEVQLWHFEQTPEAWSAPERETLLQRVVTDHSVASARQRALSRLAREHGLSLLVDASQPLLPRTLILPLCPAHHPEDALLDALSGVFAREPAQVRQAFLLTLKQMAWQPALALLAVRVARHDLNDHELVLTLDALAALRGPEVHALLGAQLIAQPSFEAKRSCLLGLEAHGAVASVPLLREERARWRDAAASHVEARALVHTIERTIAAIHGRAGLAQRGALSLPEEAHEPGHLSLSDQQGQLHLIDEADAPAPEPDAARD